MIYYNNFKRGTYFLKNLYAKDGFNLYFGTEEELILVMDNVFEFFSYSRKKELNIIKVPDRIFGSRVSNIITIINSSWHFAIYIGSNYLSISKKHFTIEEIEIVANLALYFISEKWNVPVDKFTD